MYYFSTLIGETPVAVLASQFSQAREVQPVKRKRGRPEGSKNKPKPETTRPSCPTLPKARGRGRGRGRGNSSQNVADMESSRSVLLIFWLLDYSLINHYQGWWQQCPQSSWERKRAQSRKEIWHLSWTGPGPRARERKQFSECNRWQPLRHFPGWGSFTNPGSPCFDMHIRQLLTSDCPGISLWQRSVGAVQRSWQEETWATKAQRWYQYLNILYFKAFWQNI